MIFGFPNRLKRMNMRVLPAHVVWSAISLFLGYELVLHNICKMFGREGYTNGLRPVILAGCLVGYGFYRGREHHPIAYPKYRDWLKILPWNRDRELPFGPIHLVWQDALIIGALLSYGILRIYPLFYPLFPNRLYISDLLLQFCVWTFLLFLVPYLLVTMINLFRARKRYYLYGMIFLATLIHFDPTNGQWILLVCTAMYLAGIAGVWASLAEFPWEQGFERFSHVRSNALLMLLGQKGMDWGFSRLGPVRRGPMISLSEGLTISLLGGWWFFVLGYMAMRHHSDRITLMVYFVVLASVLALGRLVIYIAFHLPPIGFFGRLLTARWVIPGYDVALVPSLLILVLIRMGIKELPACENEIFPMLFGVGTFAILAIALTSRPRLDDWNLMGHHRITDGKSLNRYVEKMKESRGWPVTLAAGNRRD
jgi:hypothetical protein